MKQVKVNDVIWSGSSDPCNCSCAVTIWDLIHFLDNQTPSIYLHDFVLKMFDSGRPWLIPGSTRGVAIANCLVQMMKSQSLKLLGLQICWFMEPMLLSTWIVYSFWICKLNKNNWIWSDSTNASFPVQWAAETWNSSETRYHHQVKY